MKTFKRSYVVTIEGECEYPFYPFAAGTLSMERAAVEAGARQIAEDAERFWQCVVKRDSRTVTVSACDDDLAKIMHHDAVISGGQRVSKRFLKIMLA